MQAQFLQEIELSKTMPNKIGNMSILYLSTKEIESIIKNFPIRKPPLEFTR